ncbi:MAG: cation:proton antiporter, partial [Micromonosporaceae bacterium]
PAVVFSVLGRREVAGRSGVLLEGESGANDPVGIALLIGLLAATGTGMSAAGDVILEFALQMVVGAAIGIAGGRALLAFMRRVPLPSEGLYPLRVLAGALVIYGAATAARGSGFLAVFIAGIVIGDERAPYKREIARFHSSLASLAEVVAFVMLGLTIDLQALTHAWAWLTGLVLAVLLAVVIRPLLAGALLWPVRLRAGERLFVLWAGLKGAVPIVLGVFIVQAGVTGARRIYEIIFVVVAFSVIVQGGTVPAAARRLKIPLRTIEPEPWSLGIRFQEEPEGLHRCTITPGITGLPPTAVVHKGVVVGRVVEDPQEIGRAARVEFGPGAAAVPRWPRRQACRSQGSCGRTRRAGRPRARPGWLRRRRCRRVPCPARMAPVSPLEPLPRRSMAVTRQRSASNPQGAFPRSSRPMPPWTSSSAGPVPAVSRPIPVSISAGHRMSASSHRSSFVPVASKSSQACGSRRVFRMVTAGLPAPCSSGSVPPGARGYTRLR